MSRIRSSAACLATVLLLFGTGCATPKWLNFSKSDLSVAGPDNPVVHILPLWQPASGIGIDKQPCRGFSGQIYFFAGKERLPAQVHGTVRVYEFDDQGPEPDRVKPIHQFDFPDTAWQMYLADTKLGPCYTLFIPYVRKGFHQAQCTLRLRLTPDNGPPIYSEMISITLPGTESDESKETAAAPLSTAAAVPQKAPAAPAAATTNAAPNAVQQAAAVVAESVNQQPRRLPSEQQQQMVRQMAQYLETTAADDEEMEAPPPRRTKKRRAARPVVQEEEFDDVEVVEYADEEPPPRSRSRRASRRRQHPLEEDEAPRARASRRQVSAHPLEIEDEEAVEEVPRQARRSVRVESAQATPVDRMSRRSSGKAGRAAARVAEPEYDDDDDDVEVVEPGEEVEDDAPDERVSARTSKSSASDGWQTPTERRATRPVIQQASAEVEVEVAPKFDAVNASTAARPKMQTFSIPLSAQSRALVAH